MSDPVKPDGHLFRTAVSGTQVDKFMSHVDGRHFSKTEARTLVSGLIMQFDLSTLHQDFDKFSVLNAQSPVQLDQPTMDSIRRELARGAIESAIKSDRALFNAPIDSDHAEMIVKRFATRGFSASDIRSAWADVKKEKPDGLTAKELALVERQVSVYAANPKAYLAIDLGY
jgi:hypothetical protein